MIRLEKIVFGYGSMHKLFDGLSLTLLPGHIHGLLGVNGTGKSTLLHVMGGVDTVTNGKVIVDDRDITTLKDEEMSVFRRRKIGFVFQSYHLIPVLTVEENIQMPILLDHKKPDREYIDHVIEMLGLKDRRKHLPNQLSGGQQQRAAIARALANRPSLILADEPTGALDSKSSNELLDAFENIHQSGQTIVMVTHSTAAAARAGRVLFIKDGEIYHQIYRGDMTNDMMYKKISDTLTLLLEQNGREI